MNKYLSYIISLITVTILSGCDKSVQSLISDAKIATVTIYTFDEYGSPSGEGSGFFIAENGTCITNYHVLDGCTKAILKTHDGKEYEIDSVLVSSKTKDLIKFNIKNLNDDTFPILRFAKGDLRQGDKIYNVSSPMGLEQTVSDGIIAALRNDSHGEIVQVTAPISQGSSGSAILNENGDVIAIATFLHKGGQNLNFGVRLSDEILELIEGNDFVRKNPKFNKKDEFVIVNIPSSNSPNVRLNAIEFKKDATIAYMSITNLDLTRNPAQILIDTENKEKALIIVDKSHDKKYTATSSSVDRENSQSCLVPLASTKQFKIVFPVIKNYSDMETIDIISGDGKTGWKFEDINLTECRNNLHYDMESYQKNFAYALMHEGELDYAKSTFLQILEDNPGDEDALNALGIISYVEGNLKDALIYFNDVVEEHPSSETGYNNRGQYFFEAGEYAKAKSDFTKSIGINASGENFVQRASVNLALEDVPAAKADLTSAIEKGFYTDDPYIYYYRARCAIVLGDFRQANEDIRQAYKLNRDPEFDKHLQELYNSIP